MRHILRPCSRSRIWQIILIFIIFELNYFWTIFQGKMKQLIYQIILGSIYEVCTYSEYELLINICILKRSYVHDTNWHIGTTFTLHPLYINHLQFYFLYSYKLYIFWRIFEFGRVWNLVMRAHTFAELRSYEDSLKSNTVVQNSLEGFYMYVYMFIG